MGKTTNFHETGSERIMSTNPRSEMRLRDARGDGSVQIVSSTIADAFLPLHVVEDTALPTRLRKSFLRLVRRNTRLQLRLAYGAAKSPQELWHNVALRLVPSWRRLSAM